MTGLSVLMRCAAAFVLSLTLCAVASAGELGEGVQARLANEGQVRVLVMLAAAGRLAEASQIAAEVDALLAELPADDVRLERRFQTVPALALTVGARGLAALATSARSGRIDLDEGGSGGLVQSLPLAQVSAMHGLGLSGAGTRIAVIDSGIRLDHQSFAGRIVDQACFCTGCCPNGGSTQFGPGSGAHSHQHGTNVAGIAAGAAGVSGVPVGAAPQAQIVSVRVLDANNSFCCSSDVIAGMDWVHVNHPGIDVVNMSLGTAARFPGNCDGATSFTLAYAHAVNNLRNLGTLVTVSSGNNGSSIDMQAPACVQKATSVAAVWDNSLSNQTVLGCTDNGIVADKVACFSNLSTTTDLLAPGAPVTAAGTASPNATVTLAGTSMAAGLVAGCAALLREAVPDAGPATIETALRASAVHLTRAPLVQTYPRVDCLDALLRLDVLFANGFQ